MLARISTLAHPLGYKFRTPLLIPSLSSRGFRFFYDGRSEVSNALETVAEVITDSLLISAYDMHYRHIPEIADAGCSPELTVIDSGGYETARDHDLAPDYQDLVEPKEWSVKMLDSVLNAWPNHIPAAFVSYDSTGARIPLESQIEQAYELLSNYPKQLSDIILKPETKKQKYIQMDKVLSMVGCLGGFSIIGATEKELGGSLLDRMENIARLRRALDATNNAAPIHIFGSLDPVTSCLYFISGAEIFDGLTWLKYSYRDGVAIYQANYGAIELGIQERDTLVVARALTGNIYYLNELRYQMQDFMLKLDFAKFGEHEEFLKSSYDRLCTRLGGEV